MREKNLPAKINPLQAWLDEEKRKLEDDPGKVDIEEDKYCKFLCFSCKKSPNYTNAQKAYV